MVRLVLLIATTLAGLPIRGQGDEPAPLNYYAPDLPPRTWRDDSGLHEVEAKLYALGPSHIALRKQDLRYAVVPVARLSVADKQYVEAVWDELSDPSPAGTAAVAPRDTRATTGPSQTVVYLTVSKEMLQQFSRPLESEWPISLCILGYPVSGTAMTRSEYSVELVPDSSRGLLEFPVRGTVFSQTVARASLVQVHTNGEMDFVKRVQLVLDGEQVHMRYGDMISRSNFVTAGVTTSARWFRNLILRIASGRAAAQKSRADAIAARYQRDRVERTFRETAEQMTRDINGQIVRALAELRQTEAMAGLELSFTTSATHLHVSVSLPVERALAPLPATESEGDFRMYVHESLFEALRGDALEELTAIVDKMLPNERGQLSQLLGDDDVEVTPLGEEWVIFSPVPRGNP